MLTREGFLKGKEQFPVMREAGTCRELWGGPFGRSIGWIKEVKQNYTWDCFYFWEVWEGVRWCDMRRAGWEAVGMRDVGNGEGPNEGRRDREGTMDTYPPSSSLPVLGWEVLWGITQGDHVCLLVA